jgi:hypothetical protein
MENLIETIRAAIAPAASDQVRAEGARACRTLLLALEANEGESLAPPVPGPAQVEALVTALRNVPIDNLLDLAITKLRAALPPGTSPPTVTPLKFHLAPIPRKDARP